VKLRDLPLGARLGIACLVLTMLGGFAASAAQVFFHHRKKDDNPKMSMDDIKGAYHGVDVTAPLLTALERNHPENLPAAQRESLLKWLRGDRISQDYDNLDLGDNAPGEIIAASCVSCHSRQSTDEVAKKVPLEYWDDVARVAFSKNLSPVPEEILVVSTHTHALSLAPLSVVIAGLMVMTRWPRRVVSLSILLSGGALFLDLGAWWVSRVQPGAVYLVVVAGGVYMGTTVLMLLGVLADLFTPRAKGAPAGL
jgi:hypothetical protein